MIVDENTNEEITARGPEARGELWCRAPNVMKGYICSIQFRYAVTDILQLLEEPESHC